MYKILTIRQTYLVSLHENIPVSYIYKEPQVKLHEVHWECYRTHCDRGFDLCRADTTKTLEDLFIKDFLKHVFWKIKGAVIVRPRLSRTLPELPLWLIYSFLSDIFSCSQRTVFTTMFLYQMQIILLGKVLLLQKGVHIQRKGVGLDLHEPGMRNHMIPIIKYATIYALILTSENLT